MTVVAPQDLWSLASAGQLLGRSIRLIGGCGWPVGWLVGLTGRFFFFRRLLDLRCRSVGRSGGWSVGGGAPLVGGAPLGGVDPRGASSTGLWGVASLPLGVGGTGPTANRSRGAGVTTGLAGLWGWRPSV